MELGDKKETVTIYIQASVICYLHVIHRYTHMVRTIFVWSYRTHMVYKIVPYTYGTDHLQTHEIFKKYLRRVTKYVTAQVELDYTRVRQLHDSTRF